MLKFSFTEQTPGAVRSQGCRRTRPSGGRKNRIHGTDLRERPHKEEQTAWVPGHTDQLLCASLVATCPSPKKMLGRCLNTRVTNEAPYNSCYTGRDSKPMFGIVDYK